MKKIVMIGLLFFVCSIFVFSAEEKNDGDHKETFGLLFGIQGLTTPVANNSNSIISGIGAKYWIFSELAVRALFFLNIEYVRVTDVTTTSTGLSVGLEYHFITGIVSPYTGGFIGIELLNDATGLAADYHGGAMLGVEINILEYLSFFIEYNLAIVINESGVEVNMGYENGTYAKLPMFGAVIYIQ